MKYIYSSVFIGAFLSTDPNYRVCRKAVDDIALGKLPAVISIFGLAERGEFFARNISQRVALKQVTALQKMENLQIYYADDLDNFMNSVLAGSISMGLPGFK